MNRVRFGLIILVLTLLCFGVTQARTRIIVTFEGKSLLIDYTEPIDVSVYCKNYGMAVVRNLYKDRQLVQTEKTGICSPGSYLFLHDVQELAMEPTTLLTVRSDTQWMPAGPDHNLASMLLTIPPKSGQVHVNYKNWLGENQYSFANDTDSQVIPFFQIESITVMFNEMVPDNAIQVVSFHGDTILLPTGRDALVICTTHCSTFATQSAMPGVKWTYWLNPSKEVPAYTYIPRRFSGTLVSDKYCQLQDIARSLKSDQPNLIIDERVGFVSAFNDGSDKGLVSGFQNFIVKLNHGDLSRTWQNLPNYVSKDEILALLPDCYGY